MTGPAFGELIITTHCRRPRGQIERRKAVLPSAEPWIDLDWQRGISLVREGDALWDAWREIAAHLESRNRQDGVSSACAGFVSE